MTLDKARELLATQVTIASGYNRNSAKLIIAEIYLDHGQAAVDQLIREMDLETAFELKVGEKIII